MALADEILDQLGYATNPGAIGTELLWSAISDAIEEMQDAADWTGQEVTISTVYQPTTNGFTLPDRLIKIEHVWIVDPAQPDPTRNRTPVGDLTKTQWWDRVAAGDASRTYPRPPIPGPFYYTWANKLHLVADVIEADTQLELDIVTLDARLDGITTTSNYWTQKYTSAVKWMALTHLFLAIGEDQWAQRADGIGQRLLLRAVKNEAQIKRGSAAQHVRGT